MLNSQRQFLKLMGKLKELDQSQSELIEQKIKLYQSEAKLCNEYSNKLTRYEPVFAAQSFWEIRQDYFQLLKRFVNKELNGQTFCLQFLELRSQNMKKTNILCEKIETNIRNLPKFVFIPKSVEFELVMSDLFFAIDQIDHFSPNISDAESNPYRYSEGELRSPMRKRAQITPK